MAVSLRRDGGWVGSVLVVIAIERVAICVTTVLATLGHVESLGKPATQPLELGHDSTGEGDLKDLETTHTTAYQLPPLPRLRYTGGNKGTHRNKSVTETCMLEYLRWKLSVSGDIPATHTPMRWHAGVLGECPGRVVKA